MAVNSCCRASDEPGGMGASVLPMATSGDVGLALDGVNSVGIVGGVPPPESGDRNENRVSGVVAKEILRAPLAYLTAFAMYV